MSRSLASNIPGTPYQYRPLQTGSEIRLLKVDRINSHHDPMDPDTTQFLGGTVVPRDFPSYSIVHFNLENAPLYEAVSYVWGSPRRSHKIMLMDGRTLYVTTSVAYAMPYLANACQTSYLWIDQITIDQSNLDERSEQVKIMGQIYRQSHRCLIWMDD